MNIVPIDSPEIKSKICNQILRALPKWFGIESSIVDYTNDVKKMLTWSVQDAKNSIGFISIHQHNQFTAEVHVIGILEDYHHQGLGQKLIETVEIYLSQQGFKFLTVKTLSEKRADENYEKTRKFYLKMGFFPIEEFKTLWGEHNPCLMMIKPIETKLAPASQSPAPKILPFSKIVKSSTEVTIRCATVHDAEQILFVSKSVIDEDIFQLTTSEEFSQITIEQEIKWIESFLRKPFDLLLVAEVENQIVGLLDFSIGRRLRIAHVGDLAMSVLKPYRNLGLGSLLLQTLIEWSKSTKKIEKINLQVHSTNKAAIQTYVNNGFVIEGTRKYELKYSPTQYVDSVLMAHFLES